MLVDFQIKAVKRDKEGHCIMIKGSIQEEDITIINIYAPNIGTPQYKGLFNVVEGERRVSIRVIPCKQDLAGFEGGRRT